MLFFLTPGGSLGKWRASGTLDRELKPCVEYARRGWNVKNLTFQKEKPSDYSLPDNMDLAWFPHLRMLPLLPLLRYDVGKWADVIKTNQSAHCWHYVRAARFWKKPILLRCGYVAGWNLEREQGPTQEVRRYQQREAWAFNAANRVQVTTREQAEWVGKRYGVADDKIAVVPNFVDAGLFRPEPAIKPDPRTVIAVGRMVSTKRLDMLIRACARAKVQKLTILGDGPERPKLEALALAVGLHCELPGRMPNEQIAAHLNQHEVYAQVSEWEGHPKTLIEAMACARTCLVANAPGLTSQMEHGRTGWVTEAAEQSLASALDHLFQQPGLRAGLGAAAREHIQKTMNFETVFEQEFAVVNRLVAGNFMKDSRHDC